ncbi:hypothetical protein ACFY2M_36730 [Streptomyces sp. NPDC001276]|uniref:hypothetical protein n=1 Tax=Streptomyces sp. NPDC001276 TaxID=3364555 RepID=UPI0036BC33F6
MEDSPRSGHRPRAAPRRSGQALAAYQSHHNEHRPHQARNQLPPAAQEQPTAIDLGAHKLLRTRILGGLITEYRYAA